MAAALIGPNFFLAGAPKCGTTALSDYLRGHPRVFLSRPKEPHYFAKDMTHFRIATTLDDYLALFKGARRDHKAIGEASVWYLYSTAAMEGIYDFNRQAKIIVMFRNPVDFLRSLHADMLFAFYEDRTDFEEAWDLQEDRRAGRHIPQKCLAPCFLQYREIAKFGDQLERLLDVFPASQVKCIIYDDLIHEPGAVYRDVLGFLGLTDDGRREFARVNPSKTHRFAPLGALLMNPPTLLRAPWNVLKKICGPGISRLGEGLIRANAKPRSAPLPRPEFQSRLRREFSPDVAKLSRLTGRDLSFWTREP